MLGVLISQLKACEAARENISYVLIGEIMFFQDHIRLIEVMVLNSLSPDNLTAIFPQCTLVGRYILPY